MRYTGMWMAIGAAAALWGCVSTSEIVPIGETDREYQRPNPRQEPSTVIEDARH